MPTETERRLEAIEGSLESLKTNHLAHVQQSLDSIGNRMSVVETKLTIGGKAVWGIASGVLAAIGVGVVNLIK